MKGYLPCRPHPAYKADPNSRMPFRIPRRSGNITIFDVNPVGPMISIVVYGRNDSYGYNLHKRAAISFNCMAEMLTDRDDEIIFVDYNTPDDFPTFPEAIRDTLTPHARSKLRILRVRPAQHERFRPKTHLVALEPISRNVAVRRSNPKNRWILSTNTDIIFIPQKWTKLTKWAKGLPEGIYHAPRLEIPEALWESMDRAKPDSIIKTVKDWGRTLHLDEVVYGNPGILYDGPGDFQLCDREALFAVHGFHEDMLKGWHVDSNLALRLSRYFGKLSDAGDTFFAYHCDHTRQITPMHGHRRVQNDIKTFVDDVTSPYIPEQAETWGLAGEHVEEVRLDDNSIGNYVNALKTAIGGKLVSPYRAWYATAHFDKGAYDARHVLPFLVDVFSAAPTDLVIGWCGAECTMLEVFAKAWRLAGFKSEILLWTDDTTVAFPGVRTVSSEEFCEKPDAFIFDYGNPREGADAKTMWDCRRALARRFLVTVGEEEKRRQAGKQLRRFIGVNAVNTSFEGFFTSLIGASATPFSSRMRHGFILPPDEDVMGKLSVGDGGRKTANGIKSLPDREGWMCYGPYKALTPGRYNLTLRLDHPAAGSAGRPALPSRVDAQIQVSAGSSIAFLGNMRAGDADSTQFSFDFDVSENLTEDPRSQFEFLVRRRSDLQITLRDVKLKRTGEKVSRSGQFAVCEPNIIPFMKEGSAGLWDKDAIASNGAESGHIGYGPYWRLLPGSYEAEFTLDVGNSTLTGDRKPEFTVEVVQQDDFRQHRTLDAAAMQGSHVFSAPFTIEDGQRDIEFRVWTSGHTHLRWTGLRIRETS
jgi:hypothetical protein